MSGKTLIPVARIERTVLRLRGSNVMLDSDFSCCQPDRDTSQNSSYGKSDPSRLSSALKVVVDLLLLFGTE